MAGAISVSLTLHESRPQRQFVRCQPHSFCRILQSHAFHLKQNLPRLHHRDPMIRRTLAFTHTGFGWLLGDWLVWKQPDPDLAAALYKTRHGHAAGFDLPVGDPA